MEAAEILKALFTSGGDPYPHYADLRALGDVCQPSPHSPVFFAVGYAAIESVLRDPLFEVHGNGQVADSFPALRELDESSMVHLNGAEHARIRRLTSKAFSRRRVAGLEPTVTTATVELLDDMAARGAGGEPIDFVQHFAYLLPVTMICNLIGIPQADREMFRPLAVDLVISVLNVQPGQDAVVRAEAAANQLNDYFTALADERRKQPRDDLISALVQVHDADDGRLSDAELLSNLNTMLVAGFRTVTHLLGNGMAIMLADPDLTAAVRQGAISPEAFVEETLRYESPLQITARHAAADTKIGGLPVRAGSQVVQLLGAGNRDPRRFANPDRFDPGRPDAGSLSFSSGPHFCLGAALARLEATVAFPLLLDRFPVIAAAGEARRQAGAAARGFEYLPVRLQ